MSKDPMGDLFDDSGITEEELNRKLGETIGDSFDLSRKGRKKGKVEQPYDIASLIEGELNADEARRGVVQEDETGNDRQEESGAKRKAREGLGLPPRDEMFDDESSKDKKTFFGLGKSKGNQDDYDDGGPPQKEGMMWKVLGVLGAAAFVNNLANKFTKNQDGGKSRGRTPLEHIATLVAILVGVAVIISFSFYIVGVMKNQNISSMTGFNEKIDYLLDGRGNKNINITGVELSSYTKPYRTLEDGVIEVIGKYGEKNLFPAGTLKEGSSPTGYVYLIYTEDAYTDEIINLTLQEIDYVNETEVVTEGKGPKTTVKGLFEGAKEGISNWFDGFRNKE